MLSSGAALAAANSVDIPPAVPVDDVTAEMLPVPKSQNSLADRADSSSDNYDSSTGQAVDPENFSQNSKNPQNPNTNKGGIDADSIFNSSSLNSNSLVVVELFSSQACVFCPKADALAGELLKDPNMVVLSCHVDYFDVKSGSLSHPFCSTQQAAYESTLRAGPKYTPQMVIDGRYDAIGYRKGDVLKAIGRARRDDNLLRLKLVKDKNSNNYILYLPEYKNSNLMKIYVLVFDLPHKLVISGGGNKGKNMTYYNVVSNVGLLGEWNGNRKILRFDPKLRSGAKGFAVLVHDVKNGHIVAAAKYINK